jgi:hypothetical protein
VLVVVAADEVVSISLGVLVVKAGTDVLTSGVVVASLDVVFVDVE